MEHIAPIIVAFTALVTALGAALRWVYLQTKARFDLIDKKLGDCLLREVEAAERHGVMVRIVEMLASEISNLSPGNNVIFRANDLMEELKLIDIKTAARVHQEITLYAVLDEPQAAL